MAWICFKLFKRSTCEGNLKVFTATHVSSLGTLVTWIWIHISRNKVSPTAKKKLFELNNEFDVFLSTIAAKNRYKGYSSIFFRQKMIDKCSPLHFKWNFLQMPQLTERWTRKKCKENLSKRKGNCWGHLNFLSTHLMQFVTSFHCQFNFKDLIRSENKCK